MNIYDLSSDYQAKLEAIAEREANGEVISNEDAIEILDLKTDVRNKIIATAKYIKNREAESVAINNAVTVLDKRKKAINNNIERNKERLLCVMTLLNIPGVKDPIMPVRRQAHKSSVVIDDTSLIPDNYKTVETVIKINKSQIAKDFELNPVAGAHLEAGEHIRIG